MHDVPEANSLDEDDEMNDEEACHEYDMTEAQQKHIITQQNKKSKNKKKNRARRDDADDDGDNTSGIRIGSYNSASVDGGEAADDDDDD